MRSTCWVGSCGDAQRFALDGGNFFLFRRHDAFQRRVARLVDARLNRQHRRKRQLHPLKPSRFEFALQFQAALVHVNLHDDRGVRQAQQFRQQHAGLSETLIVALQAGQNQVEIFVLHRSSQRAGRRQRIEQIKFVVQRRGFRDRRPWRELP